ncbi:MAG: glycosyltransferase family 2 protein, partial [Candidatus Woesebacteria bacterium]|nr:glycosyltransferase family 2 protein [Candidatus Woesebacteria bacterium]
ESLAYENKKIKYIQFSRNFGKEIATSAGIHKAKGDAAIMIDADLQHPPELIPLFLEKWEGGADIVVGIRKNNNHEAFLKRVCSFLFYKTINKISKTKITPNATDYRLLDKKVIKEFNRFTERSRIARGILDWLGFKKEFIYFNPGVRKTGKAKYSYMKLTKLALTTIIAHSLFPLKFAGYLGIIITPLAGLFGLFIWVEKYVLKDPLHYHFTGPAMLAVLTIFLVGIILICLGLMALYIAEIQGEVMNRPMYVIRKTGNINE